MSVNTPKLGGSGNMLPQENLTFTTSEMASIGFWVHTHTQIKSMVYSV